MKITPSQDGIPRATLTIKVRVGAEDLINGIGWVIVRDWTFDDAPNIAMRVETSLKLIKSKQAILSCFTRAFRSDGDAIWTWRDGFNATAVKEIEEQARVLVQQKFPALKL